MRKSRFTEEQIVSALKEHAAGAGTGELCRWLGISPETLYRWKREYGWMEVSEARRLRALEEEDRRLKRPGLAPHASRASVCAGFCSPCHVPSRSP